MAVLTAREICERALRKMGAWPIHQPAPRPEYVDEALIWLGMLMNHMTSKLRLQWLVPAALTVELTNGQADYSLATAVGPDWPADGIIFPQMATFLAPGEHGQPREVAIVRRRHWEENREGQATGAPQWIFIDRQADPVLRVYPTPDADGYVINLTAQKYLINFAELGRGDAGTGLRRSWELWVVTALARELGNGPVARLPDGEIALLKDDADNLFMDLETGDALEHSSEPHRTAYYDPAWG